MRVRALPVATLAGLLLVPAASASRPHAVRLALVPLPKAAIGSAASGLSLAHDSGPVSNAEAASHSPDATKAKLKKLGRLNGYVLEYGNAFTGRPGITDVHTGVERYKTAADAKRGLAFWQKEDSKFAELNQPGFAVTTVAVDLPAVGERHFAYLTSYSASNIAPVSGLDEQVAEGRYVLDVIVTAGDASLAQALVPTLAEKIDARLRLALRGRLHAKPVRLPKLKAGPPPGGPDLRRLALKASDLAGKATAYKQYTVDRAAVSDYSVLMSPAGQFDLLDQEIEWYPSANEASFLADFQHAAVLASTGATALDLSNLGDGAEGAVIQTAHLNAGYVVLTSGRLTEFLFVDSNGAIDASAVTSLAQVAASRIDAAGLGG
jgi:hypothetical protein